MSFFCCRRHSHTAFARQLCGASHGESVLIELTISCSSTSAFQPRMRKALSTARFGCFARVTLTTPDTTRAQASRERRHRSLRPRDGCQSVEVVLRKHQRVSVAVRVVLGRSNSPSVVLGVVRCFKSCTLTTPDNTPAQAPLERWRRSLRRPCDGARGVELVSRKLSRRFSSR